MKIRRAAVASLAAGLAIVMAQPGFASFPTGVGHTDLAAHAQPAVAQPGLYESYRDPVFGSRVTRLTASPNADTGYVPEYAKAGAFNKSGSRFLVRGTDGSSWLFDGRSLRRIRRLPIPEGDVEPRWLPAKNSVITYLLDDSVRAFNIATNRTRTLATFPGLGPLSSGAEQDHSRAGRYFALHGPIRERGDGSYLSTKAFVADLRTGKRGAIKTLTAPSRGDFLDYIAITPDGKYVMVMWAGYGARLYTRSWHPVRRLTTWDEHADFCRTAAGVDALVIVRYRPEPNDEVVELVPLAGGPHKILFKAAAFNQAMHVSCRNTARHGWAVISTYWDGVGQRPGLTQFENEVFFLSLRSTATAPIIRRLAQTRMVERNDYFDEPHATVRRDGRLILFASNFGRNSDSESYADTYAIDLRGSRRADMQSP